MNYNSKKKKLIYIRVDSSLQIGSGHVERCITLSKELKKKGMRVHFICRDHYGNMESRIKSEGFDVTILPVNKYNFNKKNTNSKFDYKHWLGTNWKSDAKDISHIILKKKPEWLIIDHYAIDFKWENLVKSITNVKIMVIDGLAIHKHNCEILLDYTYSANSKFRWDGLVPFNCKMLLGTGYTLLRPEFIKAKKTLQKRSGIIRRILIAFGGSDEFNITMKALAAVNSFKKSNIFVDVVVGKNNPNITQIQKLCDQSKNIAFHIQSSNIAKLMSKADLSIGAGGTMVWERCYLGLPSLIVPIANNQVKQSKEVNSYGAAINLGLYRKNIKVKIIRELKNLLKNKKKNISMSQKSLKLMKISNISSQKSPTKFICNILLKSSGDL